MGRVTIERDAPAAGRDADIRTYPVKAGETIRAGDVVDVVGGEAGKTWQKVTKKKTVFGGRNVLGGISVVSLNINTVVATYFAQNGSYYYIYVCAGKLLNETVEWGSEVALVNAGTSSGVSGVRMDRASDTLFVIQYALGGMLYTKYATCNGVTITPSEAGSSRTFQGTPSHELLQFGQGSLSIYNDNGLSASFAGYALSKLSGSTSANYISACRLPDLNGNKRVCVCYQDAGDGNKGKAVIATIKSDNLVEWGSPVVFNASTTYYIHCCTDGNDVVVTYQGVGDDKYANILAIQESNIFVKTPLNIGPMGSGGSRATPVEKIGNSFVVVRDLNKTGIALLLKRNVNDLQKCNEFMFDSGGFGYGNPAICTTPNKLLVGYPAAANPSYGTATLLEVRGDQIAGGWEDVSSQAIALQSSTGGQRIDVIYDGTAELPGITAGTSITSAGVQGYSPQDGWVWVKPEWGASSGMTGSYTGDGAEERSIHLGFRPSLVVVQGAVSAGSTMYTVSILANGIETGFHGGGENGVTTASPDDTGFALRNGNLNKTGYKYTYMALR